MKFFVSSLINDFDKMEEIALWINELNDPNIGVELIAFTHDEKYWDRLLNILNKINCPISFHGPYIDVEATSKEGSKEYDFFIESYRKVAKLANKYNVAHIVFHYSQLQFDKDTIDEAKVNSVKSINEILKIQEEYQVPMLIENLAFAENMLPLYNNEEYNEMFKIFKESKSIIDIGHANINKLNLEDFLKNNGNIVKAYHFHNNDGKEDTHERVRDGNVNYHDVMDLFNKYTPNANIVLEYEPHTECSKEDILSDIEFIKSKIEI